LSKPTTRIHHRACSLTGKTATAHYQDGKLEMWVPSQTRSVALGQVAKTLGITEKASPYTYPHGRRLRAAPNQRLHIEGAYISKVTGAPVNLMDAQDDIATIFTVQQVSLAEAGLDAPVTWSLGATIHFFVR